MSNVEVERSIEAILMVVDEPVTEIILAQVLERPVEEIEVALAALEGSYEDRGFSLRKINGGWRFYSNPNYSAVVEKFVLDGQQSRLTQAALETLSVIAYRQPVTRGDLEDIRGVTINSLVLKQLEDRGWVEVIGHRETVGRPALFATTRQFLDDLGLASLDQLPIYDTEQAQANAFAKLNAEEDGAQLSIEDASEEATTSDNINHSHDV